MKRAVVVAHPDDETLWAGGLIIRHPGDWTIICCSVPRADPIRAVKFHDACKILGAEGQVFPHQESPANEEMTWLEEIDLSPFDHIVTHNNMGEYGHLQHKQVHRHVVRKYGKKKITTFGYRPGALGVHKIALTEFESARKLKALKAYDHLHPYGDGCPPKWEALLHRYIKIEGIDFDTETFDGAMP